MQYGKLNIQKLENVELKLVFYRSLVVKCHVSTSHQQKVNDNGEYFFI